jgi:hypothetical protein
MSLTEPRQLATINSLRSYIDSTHDLSIKRKGDLIKDLNRKKEQLIASVTNTLSSCRDSESVLYHRWIGTSNKVAHDHLEEYNKYLKDQHDRGSEIIGHINAMNNFEQLNKYESNTIAPYLDSLKAMCNKYSQKIIVDETPTPVPLIQSSPQTIQSATSIQPTSYAPYIMATKVVQAPPVKVVQPTQVIQATPVRVVQPAQVVPVSPVRVVQPTQVVPVSPVRVVQPTQVVPVSPVRVVQPTQVIKATRVRVVKPTQSKQPVYVTGVPNKRKGVHKGVLIENYSSKASRTLALSKDTVVNVLKYKGDWAYVETNDGHKGYVSKHFIRIV